jgi:hypothetical protein
MDDVVGLVGRDRQLDRAEAIVAKGSNLLVTGRAGIGKSAFLRALFERARAGGRPCVWVPEGNTRSSVIDLARQVHETVGLRVPEEVIPTRWRAQARRTGRVEWARIERTVARRPSRDNMAMIAGSLKGHRALVFIESLEVPPSQAEFYAVLPDVAQLVAAMDSRNTRVRIQRLLWRFQEQIELQPLDAAASRAIAERWLGSHTVRFETDRVREAFLKAVAQDSGGVPTAIEGMLSKAATEPEVTRSSVREFTHEAGVRYIDMTPTIVVGFVAVIAGRYIARGLDSMELYVLSGIGIALFLGLRFAMGRMSR